jgi:hypothetical protein
LIDLVCSARGVVTAVVQARPPGADPAARKRLDLRLADRIGCTEPATLLESDVAAFDAWGVLEMGLSWIRRMTIVAGMGLLLGGGSAAAAVLGLPSNGSQVNNDLASGIDPGQSAGLSDVVGGSLAAAGPLVPWATFEQKAGSAQHIFVRAFKNGQWVTQGLSLNISAVAEAEAPSIDFAGTGGNTPWVTWYEPSTALGGSTQVFASRFCAAASAVCAAANTWVPEGQNRGSGVPSLNIHTSSEAENPAVAGGAAVPGNPPVPWVAWQEQDGNVNGSGQHDQIFVSKGVKQATASSPCTGFKPSAAPSVSFFCWQQVGADRLAASGGSSSVGDPALNVDPSRNGIEPDIAFTGPSDKVAWVVWYETGPSALGLRSNEQVFAAKLVADPAADGGFHWQAVGSGTVGLTNTLDTSSAPPGFGPCAASVSAEDGCSLNANPARDAEDPSVASGTLTPGTATVPWVVWAEDTGSGKHAIFIARLVGGDHFELFNGGAPLSTPNQDATNPDITFFGNVPYVSWIEARGTGFLGFVGHFESGAFVLDTPEGIALASPPRPASLIDFRVPISSSCIANPFTSDGSTCPVAAINAPFSVFTTAGTPQRLFSEEVIGGPNCVLFSGCSLAVVGNGAYAFIEGTLGQSETVGILVQRIIRTKRVHGRKVLVLRAVGHVPLGHHPAVG